MTTNPAIRFYPLITDIFALQNELLDIVYDKQLTPHEIGPELIKTTKIRVAKVYCELCELERNINQPRQ